MEIAIIAFILGWLIVAARLVNNWVPLNWPYHDLPPALCRHCGGVLTGHLVQWCRDCECSFDAADSTIIIGGEGCPAGEPVSECCGAPEDDELAGFCPACREHTGFEAGY